MVRASSVTAELSFRSLPVFSAVVACLEHEILGGAIERNQEYAMAWVKAAEGVDDRALAVLYDPQTSGGLLIALPPKSASEFVREMHRRHHEATAVIGRLIANPAGVREGQVVVTDTRFENLYGTRDAVVEGPPEPAPSAGLSPVVDGTDECCADLECCASPGSDEEEKEVAMESKGAVDKGTVEKGSAGRPEGGGAEAAALFTDYMKAANRPGLVDGRTKKLIAVALSIVQHCEPCLRVHLKGALEMGITAAELDEAANLAVEFGGCPALMFYREVSRGITG